MTNLAYVVAFGVACAVVLADLLSSEYPRTYFTLVRSRSLALYAALYGLLGALALALLDGFVGIRLGTGAELTSPWAKAVVCGAAIKSTLQLNFATLRIGAERIPVGLKTLAQLFEPTLLRNIAFDEFLGVREFVSSFVRPQVTVEETRAAAIGAVPPTLSEAERTAFVADVEAAPTAERVMTLYLRFGGRDAFVRVWPRATSVS